MEAIGPRWTITRGMRTSIGPGWMGTTGAQRTAAGKASSGCSRKSIRSLQRKKKPILIGEMSSSQAGGDKAKWIDEIIPILRGSFPLIKGVVWFDIDKEADWRI